MRGTVSVSVSTFFAFFCCWSQFYISFAPFTKSSQDNFHAFYKSLSAWVNKCPICVIFLHLLRKCDTIAHSYLRFGELKSNIKWKAYDMVNKLSTNCMTTILRLNHFFSGIKQNGNMGLDEWKKLSWHKAYMCRFASQKIFIAFFSLLSFEAYERCVLFPHELAFILCVCVGSNFTDEMAFYLLKSDFWPFKKIIQDL